MCKALVFLLCTLPALAHAQLLVGGYIKTEHSVTAGLDAPTRTMLEGLPKTIKEQTLDGLEKALPLIDTSINAHLDRVNELVFAAMNQASCLMVGTGKAMGEEFVAAVLKQMPRPVTNLNEMWDAFPREISKNATPQAITLLYSDYLARSTVVACQVAHTPEALGEVDKLRMLARARFQVWQAISGTCRDTADCFRKQHAETKKLLAASDPRDTQISGATQLVSTVSAPREGPFTAFDFTAYETRLATLHRAKRELDIARTLREQSARAHLQKGQALYATANSERLAAAAAVSGTDISSNARAVALGSQALAGLDAIRIEIDVAVKESSRLKPETDRIRADIDTIAKLTPAVVTQARQHQARLNKEAQDRAETERLNYQMLQDAMRKAGAF